MSSYGDDLKCKKLTCDQLSCDQAQLHDTQQLNVESITGTTDPATTPRPGKVGDLYFRTVAGGESKIYCCTAVSAPDPGTGVVTYTWTVFGEANTQQSGGGAA